MSAIAAGRARVASVLEMADESDLERDAVARCIEATQGDVVYFMQAGEDGPVKIGKTTVDALERRRAAIQIGNPYPLRTIGVAPGGLHQERLLHRLFAHLRMEGEWFYPDEQLLEVANVDPLGLLS